MKAHLSSVIDRPTVPRSLTTRRIALLGFARSYQDAPFTDESVCIAGMNELYKLIPRWDVWFELHDTGYLGKTARAETPNEPTRHLEWLKAQPADKPIYMLKRWAEIPASVPYPLEAMIATFGRYFTSTVGYMLAWAITEIVQQRTDPKVPEPGEWIGLYGIDLASGTEYAQQRPNAEYLVGYARGLGIQVEIPEHAAICHADGLYGFEPPPNEVGAVNEHFLRVQLARANHKRYEAEASMRTLDGVLQLAHTLRTEPTLQPSPKTIEFLEFILKQKGEERGEAMANWNAAGGCVNALELCLQAMEFRRRGVYIPECDPFAPKDATCS
ncbi:MAG TPA: hypothetical protein VEU08_02410 [Vicinamibacterales bacterium]|nr:hypothetical protein [Vicinamibacterales bacterium]